jgi:hypothetical protein
LALALILPYVALTFTGTATGLQSVSHLEEFPAQSPTLYSIDLISHLSGSPITPPNGAILAALLAALGLVGLLRREYPITHRLLLVSWVLGPAILGFGFQQFIPFFFPRFLLYIVPAFYLLVAAGVVWLFRRLPVAGIAVSALLIGFHAVSLAGIYTRSDEPNEDYRPLIAHLQPLARPGDVVIYGYLWQVGYLSSYFPGNALTYRKEEYAPEAIERELGQLLRDHARIWRVYYGGPRHQPGSQAGLDEEGQPLTDWLKAHAVRVGHWRAGRSELALYVRPDATIPPLGEPAQMQSARFGSAIEVNYTPLTVTVAAGDVVAIPLTWRASATLERSYAVFVHVRAPDGRPMLQSDSDPAGGAHPTNTWDHGERVGDLHTMLIGADMPQGRFPVYVGLYERETGARLAVQDMAGRPLGDGLMIGTIEVKPPSTPTP